MYTQHYTYIILQKQQKSHHLYQNKYNVLDLYQEYYICNLPKFITRIIMIYISYLISLKILYFTTRYENIIIFYLTCSINYKTNKYSIFKKQILIIVLASNFLILINNKICNLNISIKLRNSYSIANIHIYYYALNELLHNLIFEIYRITSILYSREINYKNLILKNIYYF